MEASLSLFFFLNDMACGILGSIPAQGTMSPFIGSTEYSPLDHQGSLEGSSCIFDPFDSQTKVPGVEFNT